MARDINQVFLIGRLTKDVELRSTPQGKNVASFSLAVNKGTQDDKANFFDITAWEKTAELVSKYLHKGSKVAVIGTLEQQTWQQDGQNRSKVVVIARDVNFLDTKSDSSNQTKLDDVHPVDDDEPVNLDDIPF